MLYIMSQFWFIWLLIFLTALLKIFRPTIKGWIGEKAVSVVLGRLPKDEYTTLNDMIFDTNTGTTQVDHIVISQYGVFVIEVKNYTGWIFGSEKSAQWTQNIYGKKSRFMNPIHQNYAHVKAVESKLSEYGSVPIIPIVAFSPKCDLKIETTSHVVYFHRINQIIQGYMEKVIGSSDVAAIVNKLQNQTLRNPEAKQEHILKIEEKINAFETLTAGSKCPKCEGTLIERNGKYGSFLGCSNYPKCRFTRN